MFDYFLYKFGQFLVLCLPRKMAYRIAVFISDIHYLFANVDRANVRANLAAIFPEKPLKERDAIRLRMSRNFTKYLADFFKFSQIDAAYIKKYCRIENKHFIDDAAARGRGVIFLTAHIGNWELGGVVLAQSGYDLWVVALEHKNKKVNDFFDAQRESKGIHVIPFNKAVRQSIRVLKENRQLALVGDRDFTKDGGIIVDFFGKPTSIPKGPAALALKTGALIIPGFFVRNPDDTFTLMIEPAIDPYPSGSQETDPEKNSFTQMSEKRLRELTLQFTKIIEDYIRRYPDQWYMYRTFWVEDKS